VVQTLDSLLLINIQQKIKNPGFAKFAGPGFFSPCLPGHAAVRS
jgi:hypothetical protein